jgi:hypothetical protein
MHHALSNPLPAGEPKAAGKGDAATAVDDGSEKPANAVPERRPDGSRLFLMKSEKKTAPATGAPAQSASIPTRRTWSSDAETLVAGDDERPRPDGARIAREQVRRCEAHHERSIACKLRDNVKGMATLSSTGAPPAFQIQGDRSTVATQIVSAVHWELQRVDPANIDPVELAHAVACVERWRSDGHPDDARDAAIDAWLKAFSLHETMSAQSLNASYEAGSIGYEHKGKSIAANMFTGLVSGVVSVAAHASPEATAAVEGIRAVGSAVTARYEAGSGMERFKRLPQEELAPLLMIDTKERAAQAPGMKEALQLARGLRQAGKDQAGERLPAQERLLDQEKMVKARLNISAEEWIGKRRELPVRALATGMTGAGAAVSLSLPPLAALLPIFIGASAAVHASYRLMGWDRADTRDRLRLRLFNHIKSYSWAATRNLAPSRIAHLYGEFDAGKISRAELAEEVRPLLVHAKTGAAMRFPAALRLERAEDLLRGKLAAVLGQELKRRRNDASSADADANAETDAEAGAKVRELLADLFNLQRAKGLIVYATRLSCNGFPEREEAVLKSAASYLQAVSDADVDVLFTGDMAAQAKVVTQARKLMKDEASSFKYTLGIGALPNIAFMSVATSTIDAVHSLGGNEAGSAYKGGASGSLAATSGLTVGLMPRKAASEEDAEAREGTRVIPVADKPAAAEDFAAQTLDVLLRDGRMPAGIVFNSGKDVPDAEVFRISADLSATEPYSKADRDRQDIGRRTKRTWKHVAAGASAVWESAREPFLRQAVCYHMRRSRKSRRARQGAVERRQAASTAA